MVIELGHQTIELQIIECLTRLSDSSSVHDATVEFAAFIAEFNYDFAMCIRVPDPGEKLDSCFLVNTLPDGWVAWAKARQYPLEGTLLHAATSSRGPFFWSDAKKWSGATELAELFETAASFGMCDGMAVPMFDGVGLAACVLVAGKGDKPNERARTAIEIVATMFYHRMCLVTRNDEAPEQMLSPRELECLKWVASGKSDWDIGKILGISDKTVNYHVENIKRKFAVSTRIQAVVHALRYGRFLR